MTDETAMQVPVSRLYEIATTVGEESRILMVDALLSRPNPSAESDDVELCDCGEPAAVCAAKRALPTEQPRIEDMAPGTALTADITFAHRFLRTTNGLLDIDDGMTVGMDDIDPSTIRDVTPPATQEKTS